RPAVEVCLRAAGLLTVEKGPNRSPVPPGSRSPGYLAQGGTGEGLGLPVARAEPGAERQDLGVRRTPIPADARHMRRMRSEELTISLVTAPHQVNNHPAWRERYITYRFLPTRSPKGRPTLCSTKRWKKALVMGSKTTPG